MVAPKPKKPKSKPKPKPVIEYPPVPQKKWVPPDQRKKPPKPKPAYQKPEGITQKLPVSSLDKIWHNFRIIGDVAVLAGNYSQTNKRFRPKSNGYQGASNCVVACAFGKMSKMSSCDNTFINSILDLGDALYLKSLLHNENKCKVIMDVEDVYTSFYIGDTRFTMVVGVEKITDRLTAQIDKALVLRNALQKFLRANFSGIISFQGKWFAMWQGDLGYYIFSPYDNTPDGGIFKGLNGDGVSVVVKCKNTRQLAQFLLARLNQTTSCKFIIHPCTILRMVKINTEPPKVVPELSDEEKKWVAEKQERLRQILEQKKSLHVVPEPPPAVPQEVLNQIDEISPDIPETISLSKKPSYLKDANLARQDVPKSKVPVEKPRKESISFFIEFVPEKAGILRASTHQYDTKFVKFKGRQTVPMAVAALTMLRVMKSRHWYRQVLDEVILLGNNICRLTLKENGHVTPDIKNLTKTLQLGEQWYTPVIEFAVLGKVTSLDNKVVDLQIALDDFLRDHDTCLISGPHTVAVWVENGLYYMFDPCDRDENGKRTIYNKKLGSNILIGTAAEGKACVIWFKNVKNLVDLYVNNLESKQKTDYFKLYKVQINDFSDIPSAWYNFQGVSRNKWILRGSFSQNSSKFPRRSRNTQCTVNATMALAFAKMQNERDWDSNTVDQVLIAGDKLYNKCVDRLKEQNKYVSSQLMVDEVDRQFPVEDKQIELDVADCLVNGIVGARESSEILNLRKGFEEFFKDNESGVVTSHNISVAVWKTNEIYYYYDSHSRDEKGVVTSLGTACLLRIMGIPELSRSLETNLGPDKSKQYNISRIIINFLERDPDGTIKPPANNFTMLNNLKAILRATLSEKSPKYELNVGKQTIPMCLMALGFSKLVPACTWSIDNLDQIIDMGNEYYVKVMAELLDEDYFLKEKEAPGPKEGEEFVAPPLEEEDAEDSVTSENIKKIFNIGLNQFEFEIEPVGEGTVELNLADAIRDYYGIPAQEDPFVEGLETGGVEDASVQPSEQKAQAAISIPEHSDLLLETSTVTVSIWYDGMVFYLFDPRARDETGQVIGKDDWSAKVPEYGEDFEYEGELDEEQVDAAKPEGEEQEVEDYLALDDEPPKPAGKEKGAGDMRPAAAPSAPIPGIEKGSGEPQDGGKELEDEEMGAPEDDEEGESEPGIREKHSSGYWRELEKGGKACTMWFVNPNDLINHIIENTPPNKREEMPFKLNVIKLTNTPQIKEVFDPETEERRNVFAGDWYEFKEIEYGRWILRGKTNMNDEMFPAVNRDKQAIPSCMAFLAYSHLYAMSKFKQGSIDGILKYGDRMYSFISRLRKAELKKNTELGLTNDEIEGIVNSETYELKDFQRKFCIGEHKIEMDIREDYFTGHIAAKDEDEVWNLNKGLLVFFEAHRFGLLSCKGLTVGIWRGEKLYYMFDPFRRGPKGLFSPNGVPCITRYLSLDRMVKIFKENLPREGRNIYSIHNVEMQSSACPRERHPQPEPEEEKKKELVNSYKSIIPGKTIVRGSISQEHEMFNRGPNVQSAPVAFMALSMSLIHKPRTWARPIIDEIIMLGDRLYLDSIDELGFDYNPWEDYLDIYKVKTDYKIGVVRANVELRHMDQKGIIDVKNSKTTQNLRQGIEKFFEENTHGILVTKTLTLAIWEQDEEDAEALIYMFDPNPRGNTGLPNSQGTACCLSFLNAKLTSDHILACIPDPTMRQEEFTIVPVEIVVGGTRVGRKKKSVAPKKKMGDEHPTAKLPRCNRTLALEQKRELRRIAERERQKKEARAMALLGRREYHYMKAGEAILRGLHSQNSEKFPEKSRNNQDIPNCIVANVLSRVVDISKWTFKHIDSILDTGNQLYIDSYITYKPTDPKLGMMNIMRKFFFRDHEIEVTIFKPIKCKSFTSYDLQTTLIGFFNQENCCILNYKDQWVTMFLKAGLYYVFDPHDRDHNGNKVQKGSAVVLQFDMLETLCDKVTKNLTTADEVIEVFSVTLVKMKKFGKVSDQGV